MKHITSRENAIYREALKLRRKKYRDRSGLFLLEGIKPLRDAAETGAGIERIFIDAAMYDGFAENAGALAALAERIWLLDDRLFRELSDTATSQGVISAVAKPATAEAGKALTGGNVLVLDRLQDPGNIGTVIRTAEAAGYGGIIAMKGTGDIYSLKVSRAAACSLLRMPVLACENADEAAELLHELGKKLAVTCLEDAVSCFEADLTDDIALVIGNEGQGVSRAFMELADIRITIPMKGDIESLNAAVAAGILMYQSVGGKF